MHIGNNFARAPSPLVKDNFLSLWLETLDGDEAGRERVLAEIRRLIDEERNEAEFILSVKATLIIGHKAD